MGEMRVIASMRILRTFGTIASALLMATCVAGAQSANLLTNGSFEAGREPGVSRALYAGSRDIDGWVVTAPVDYIGTFWQASNGRRSVDLDGTPGPGAIAQTFKTTPGQTYLVGFDMAANTDGPPRIKRMLVSVAGVRHEFDFDMMGHSKAAMGWIHHEFTFVAESPASTLSFSSLSVRGNWNGAALDNVSVTAATSAVRAPAPASPVAISTIVSAATIGDLSGTWLGRYPGKNARVRINQKGRHVTATLLESDGYVPAGKTSWYGENTGHTFFVRQACAQRNYTAPVWKLGTVVVESPASFSLFVTGCGNAKISFSRI